MGIDNETQIKRFKIIEPFLRKEKKLKEIEQESKISYATLKRWIKAYKENGVLGLDKKERQDKNSFRVIDDEGIDIIKKVYKESNEKSISKLYAKCRKNLSENKYSISYPTFYRIVSNLDGFFKKTSRFYMKKIKKENDVYGAVEMSLYVLVKVGENEYKVPKVLVIFDIASLEIINYSIYYDEIDMYSVFGFLRETILKVSAVNKKFIKPKEILIDFNKFKNRELIKNIYDNTGIKILDYESHEKKIDEFMEFLKEDIYKMYVSHEKKIDEKIVRKFLDEYIYLGSEKYKISVDFESFEKEKKFRELDVFLQSVKRKVNMSSLRFKNNIYKDDILKNFNGREIEIKVNPAFMDRIYIFSENEFLGVIEK